MDEDSTTHWLNTFEFEKDGDHVFGSRWEPFDDNARDFVDRLPHILPEAGAREGYADFYPAPRQCPPHWPRIAYLGWPEGRQGVLLALKLSEQANVLVSMFPYWRDGVEHGVTLKKVIVWQGEAEAQISCSLGDASVTFFDVLYGANRAWYRSGDEYQFILTGIAYHGREAGDEIFDMSNEKLGEIMRDIARREGDDPDAPGFAQIHTRGMAALLPIPEWDVDDYHFRGPIKEVNEIEMLGQPAWLVRATLLRGIADDDEFDFNIVVTRKIWESDEPPRPGQDIEGAMWLQGYLWSPVT